MEECGRNGPLPSQRDFLLSEHARPDVDISAIRIDAAIPTGASAHLSRSDGNRAIHTSIGPIGRVSSADVPDVYLEGFNHLHVGRCFLQRSLWSDAPVLFARARATRLTTSLDGTFDPDEQWDSGIIGLLAEVDVYFGSEQELCDDADDARRLLGEEPLGDLLPKRDLEVPLILRVPRRSKLPPYCPVCCLLTTTHRTPPRQGVATIS